MSIEDLFNTECTIQKNVRAQDANSGQMIDSWEDYAANVPCRLDMAGSGQVRVPDNIYVRATHILFIGYRRDTVTDEDDLLHILLVDGYLVDGYYIGEDHINENDYRIVCQGRAYTILLVTQAGGMEHHTEMYLEVIR